MISESIILSGLNKGFKSITPDSFDPRSDEDVMDEIMSNQSFAVNTIHNGKEYILVGLKLIQDVGARTVGRDGYSFAAVEVTDDLPFNIIDILIQNAVKNVSSVYSDINDATINSFKPIKNMINENESEVEYLMSKFYEYRNLAAEAGANGAKEEAADFNKQAMEYYERAMDLEVANMSNSNLSPEDQAMIDKYEDEEANREVPRDYASMYENETKNNKMENLDLNRWAKLAGINENEKIYRRDPRGNEEWEGSINGLGKEGHPRVFDRMGDIILANYPEEGNSTYRMEVYYNDNNEPTGASGGFAIEKGNVYFDFKFKGDQVVDFKFNEQKY